jgi:DNA ligase (NAD+)
MSNIKEYLDKAAKAYFEGNPIIPDEVFDRLADSAGYNSVGARQHEHIQEHYFPMYSLAKYYEDEKEKKPLEGEASLICSVKLDGAAISILYVGGVLSRVLTRGDGKEGTNITDKFRNSSLIPQTIEDLGVLQITGEIVAPSRITNARNYAAGALNLKDINEFKSRDISFYAYSIQPCIGDTYITDMEYLGEQGFETILTSELEKTFPTDGYVFRVSSNTRFNELGYTSKAPKGAYALKTRGEEVETTLLAVEWNTSKSGRVTPVAILDPVYIGDKLVSRATLNNPGFIEALDIQIGSCVALIMGGEIIPKIVRKIN